jgi:hypothetical protein
MSPRSLIRSVIRSLIHRLSLVASLCAPIQLPGKRKLHLVFTSLGRRQSPAKLCVRIP